MGDKVYAPGKWTIKDILQHLIDTERIFGYRALAFARSEKQAMPTFDEDDYANKALANNRTLESLIDELILSHKSFKALFLLRPKCWTKCAVASKVNIPLRLSGLFWRGISAGISAYWKRNIIH